MYKDEPWTLNKKKSTKKSRVSNYIEEKQMYSEIAVTRVRKYVELHKEKAFTITELADALDLSEGTISSIMNRLATHGGVSVVRMQRPHWSPVFQHSSTAPCQVPFTYKKEDGITKVLNFFEQNNNEVYTKATLLDKLVISESMLNRCLQIFLTSGTIKLVGSSDGCALYQHKSGKAKGIKIHLSMDENYMFLADYLEKNSLNKYEKEFKKQLINKGELFYSKSGLRKCYPIEELDKIAKKVSKKNILNGLFGRK